MKTFLFGLITTSLFFSACRKDLNSDKILPGEKILATDTKIENGTLVFSTITSFESVLNLEDKENFIKSLPGNDGFIGFKNRKVNTQNQLARSINGCDVPDELIENNTAFFDLVDINGKVQIDGIIYRYDYCNNLVWVISAANNLVTGNNIAFMNGTEISGVVGSFPTKVDVLEAVAAGYTDMPDSSSVQGNEIFETKGILGNTKQEYCYINNNEANSTDQNVLMDGKLAYDAFGLYFHFYGKEKYKIRSFINWDVTSGGRKDWNILFKYTYRRKGSSSDSHGTGQLFPEARGENKVDKTFYEGNRGLKFGISQWNVNNMWTNKMRVERNGGTAWYLVGNYSLGNFEFKNNNQYPGVTSFFTNTF